MSAQKGENPMQDNPLNRIFAACTEAMDAQMKLAEEVASLKAERDVLGFQVMGWQSLAGRLQKQLNEAKAQIADITGTIGVPVL